MPVPGSTHIDVTLEVPFVTAEFTVTAVVLVKSASLLTDIEPYGPVAAVGTKWIVMTPFPVLTPAVS